VQAELEQLLILQDRQQKIKQIQTEIRNLPLQRQNLEAQLAASIAALAALKRKAQHLEMDRKGSNWMQGRGRRRRAGSVPRWRRWASSA
jgi:hypothetical protein